MGEIKACVSSASVNVLVNARLLRAVRVGKDNVEVYPLKYANDSLLITKGSVENARSIKWLMKFLSWFRDYR